MSHRRPESLGVQARGGATEIRRLWHRPRGGDDFFMDFTGFGMKKPGKNQGKMVGFHGFGMRKTGNMMGFHGFHGLKIGAWSSGFMGISPGKMGGVFTYTHTHIYIHTYTHTHVHTHTHIHTYTHTHIHTHTVRYWPVKSGLSEISGGCFPHHFVLGCHKQRWNVIGI